MDRQLIIIGGGTSIQEGIQQELWDKLKGKLTFGLNYSYNFFQSTAQFYVDEDFYLKQKKELDKLPLVIGKYHRGLKESDNFLMLKAGANYDPSLLNGVYKSSLVGLYALSIAVYLQPKEIFLLGYDYGDNKKLDEHQRKVTHFYQGKINHRGIGKVNYYTPGRAKKDFKVFSENKIFNVSKISKIPTFEKLSYEEFFKVLENKTYDQDKLREEIKVKLNQLKEIQRNGKGKKG